MPVVNLPASLSESKYTFWYVAPFLASTSFASEISASFPSSVKEFTPMSAPFFSASSLFSASSSPSSPTQGLQVVNQKFTTVTAFLENSSSLLTGFPSRSLPSKAGNFCTLLSSEEPAWALSPGILVSLSMDCSTISGYFCSSSVSLFSISLIFSAEVLSSSYSSSENWSLTFSIVSSRKSP